MKLVRVKSVKPLHDHVVHVWFTDGTNRVIDLEKYLDGPIFERLKNDPVYFKTVKVTEGKTIGWGNNEVDIDPDVLYHDLTPACEETREVEMTLSK